jgi:hypothetical protein
MTDLQASIKDLIEKDDRRILAVIGLAIIIVSITLRVIFWWRS